MARIASIPVAGLLMVAALSAASADPPEAKKDNPDKESAAESDKEYRRAAERLIGGIEFEVQDGDDWTKVKRIEKPLLFYGDPTRENDRGSLWGWGEKGRPIALLELYQNVTDRTKWVYALCNTSGKKLRASRAGNAWWRENESAAELKDVPGAPVPSTDAAQRQRQLKALAQKFSGHQFWDPNNSRYELRRLERPLHTYRDEDGGVLDGSLYTLANGTNPEIMLFVEARVSPTDKTKVAWQYTVGRLAHAELHLEYDGKEVYSAPRGNLLHGPNKPYWLGFLNSVPESKPDKE